MTNLTPLQVEWEQEPGAVRYRIRVSVCAIDECGMESPYSEPMYLLVSRTGTSLHPETSMGWHEVGQA